VELSPTARPHSSFFYYIVDANRCVFLSGHFGITESGRAEKQSGMPAFPAASLWQRGDTLKFLSGVNGAGRFTASRRHYHRRRA